MPFDDASGGRHPRHPSRIYTACKRVRALARFSALGWVEDVGTLIIGMAFGELARANGDYPNGQTFDNPDASHRAPE